MCNTYYFSTVTTVARTHINVMFKRTLVDSAPRVFLVDTGPKMRLQPGFF